MKDALQSVVNRNSEHNLVQSRLSSSISYHGDAVWLKSAAFITRQTLQTGNSINQESSSNVPDSFFVWTCKVKFFCFCGNLSQSSLLSSIIGHIFLALDGPALSLDINQSAANPAALAMAILNSSKSRRRVSSNPQVPLVIISQPLTGPITGQRSPTPLGRPEKPDQTSSDADNTAASSAATGPSKLQTEVVCDPHESPGEPAQTSTDMTSLPVANVEATNEPIDSEDTPSAEEEQAVVVSDFLYKRHVHCGR